ncbi:hypothetical protein D9M73_279720 [compost metagenome]
MPKARITIVNRLPGLLPFLNGSAGIGAIARREHDPISSGFQPEEKGIGRIQRIVEHRLRYHHIHQAPLRRLQVAAVDYLSLGKKVAYTADQGMAR